MPGTTPVQGFSYPLTTDRPCDYPASVLALATALDTKMLGYDIDAARLKRRVWVKVSRTAFTYPSNGFDGFNDVSFDTVEANNGTPTDLTTDAFSVQLASGFYMVQTKVIVSTQNVGQDYQLYPAFVVIPQGGSTCTGMAMSGRDYGATICTVSTQDLCYVTNTDGKVHLGMTFSQENTASTVVQYAALSAWWIADA